MAAAAASAATPKSHKSLAAADSKSESNGHAHTHTKREKDLKSVSANGNTKTLPPAVTTPCGNTLPTPALIRLVLQSLQSLGCTDAAAQLIAETGCAAEEPVITSFRRSVLDGDWLTVRTRSFLLICDLITRNLITSVWWCCVRDRSKN